MICLIFTYGLFNDYAETIFIPYLKKQLQETRRLDVVWDEYFPDRLNESTRIKRGKGVRRKVSGNNKLPGNWKDFLCDSSNKKELFPSWQTKQKKSRVRHPKPSISYQDSLCYPWVTEAQF